MKRFSLQDSSVVVIIGSGAGGGTLANALAQRGIDVVCLEAGRRLELKDIVNDEAEMFGKLSWLDERIGSGDNMPDFPVWTCKTVGGTTVHWAASAPRLQSHEMRALSTYGSIDNSSLVDWPVSYGELEPYYNKAEKLMNVTGTHSNDRLPGNNNYLVMEAGAKKLGYSEINTGNMAINSKPKNGRPACLQIGFCMSGCTIGAKWSTLYAEITNAEASGHCEIRAECMAIKIEQGKDGKVTAVKYIDDKGQLREQKARAVCVAGNAVETTRLLINSANNKFPDGLANSSGQVGKNYMRHVNGIVVAQMPGVVNMHRGTQAAGIVRDERKHDPNRGFSGGLQMFTSPFTPESLARFLSYNLWGRELTNVLEKYDHLAAMIMHGEDLPQTNNAITLHPSRKDNYGLPVPLVHYEEHPNSIALLKYGLEKGKQIYRALGASKTYEIVKGLPATHNMGTARMGHDPKSSVCNAWGQTHDVENLFISDGSLFPTSGCANPTLTIVALVLRQADYLADQMQKSSI